MALTLYNTRTRQKESFEPKDTKKIGMYVCGPTVYDRAHIGNARPVVVYDVLYRLLKHLYPKHDVTYVRNITDVDDKINAAAKQRGISIKELTEETTKFFHEDMAALNALPPDIEPRATAHIPEMIAMIERLIAGGHAYAAEGHVLFSVSSDANYGKLSGRTLDEMIAGARVEVAPYKKDPSDFVLWKPSSGDEPGWQSPWGYGRPGWHIECSAMSTKYLGESFDIHGGGRDLIFPHHENEVAQSCCANKHSDFARFWVHNGFLTVGGEKMSKSLGNFFTVRELLEKGIDGETFRFVLLSTHYRQPLDWNDKAVADAEKSLNGFYRALGMSGYEGAGDNLPENVLSALCNDMNLAPVIEQMHLLARSIYKTENLEEKRILGAQLKAISGLLGILQKDPEVWFQKGILSTEGGHYSISSPQEQINSLIEARNAAKKSKNFAEADRIRNELLAMGIVLEDTRDGTTWRRA
ncbi:MAG: cysteine--tRNA ligase [Alphaproteobacteria bacterium]|nr:cysteine--tRNA ligase [Alphaproteobacteria bacterium]